MNLYIQMYVYLFSFLDSCANCLCIFFIPTSICDISHTSYPVSYSDIAVICDMWLKSITHSDFVFSLVADLFH